MRSCEHCAGELPKRSRVDARFCSSRCRTANHREEKRQRTAGPAALPVALTRLNRWVRRSASKVPLTTAGSAASSTNPTTWTTYEEASRSTVGAGLGFVLSGDGIICVDLDHCLSPDGTLTTAAAAFLATLPPTYIEVSPSGDGLHCWGRGLALTCRKSTRPELPGEVVGSRKYATITGRRFRGAPLTLANIAGPARTLIS